MISVGLIGLDGSGKTSVAAALTERLPFKTRRVYMGTNLESSNVLLPTSRLLRYLRRRRLEKRIGGQAAAEQARSQLASNRFRQAPSGTGRAALRTIQRLAESAYRAAYVSAQRWTGAVVISDRHLFYENLSRKLPGNLEKRELPDRIFLWCTDRLLPRPDLVILLDLPAEVAYGRKPELSIEEFEKRRRALRACAAEDGRITVIDATAPLDVVVGQAAEVIQNYINGRRESPLAGGVNV